MQIEIAFNLFDLFNHQHEILIFNALKNLHRRGNFIVVGFLF